MRIRPIVLFSAIAVLGLPLAGHAGIKTLSAQGSSPLPRTTLVESPADPPTYFPLATSTPFLVTNSGTPSGTVAPWAFQATSSSCGSNTNLLMQWENNSGTTPGAAYLTCIGGFSVSDGLGVDSGTPPPYGLAGGTGAQPFNFNSNSGSTATTGFAFNNPECEVGSNGDVMLFLKNGTVASWIGCDGS